MIFEEIFCYVKKTVNNKKSDFKLLSKIDGFSYLTILLYNYISI